MASGQARAMILTVTPNVAIDRTYLIERIEVGAVHKVGQVIVKVGGKGINVSRVLACLGEPSRAAGIFAADAAEAAERELTREGIATSLFRIPGAPRQTVTVSDRTDGRSTAFDEPGPEIDGEAWQGLLEHVRELLGGATWLVVAGSLAPGTPRDGLRDLVAAARRREVATVLDARGEPLVRALAAGPSLVKLNRAELAETTGQVADTDAEIAAAARELQRRGAGRVVVTLGERGTIGCDDRGCWRVRHPAAEGNPIGAGDAFTAGLVTALCRSAGFADALADGAATAVASLGATSAGVVMPSAVEAARRRVTVEPCHPGGEDR